MTEGTNENIAARDGEGVTFDNLYQGIRRAILDCEIAPGSYISQVQLAKSMGVSRTPLREALRLLEREGLVESQHNRRVRVSGFSVDEFEQIAAERILLETLVSRVSVRSLTPIAIDELARHVKEMGEAANASDYPRFVVAHTNFHLVLTRSGGTRMAESLQRLTDLAGRYRKIYGAHAIRPWQETIASHEEILAEVRTFDPDRVGNAIARYLAARALEMINDMDPDRDPALIRQAVAMSTTEID